MDYCDQLISVTNHQLLSTMTEFPVGLSEFSCKQNIASQNI